jgi:hypothetical protein
MFLKNCMSDCISGYCKSGFCISGFCISGYCISGYCISGHCISGYCISGYCNIGLLSYRVFVQDCSDFCHIGLLHIGLLQYRVIVISGFCSRWLGLAYFELPTRFLTQNGEFVEMKRRNLAQSLQVS